MNLRVLDGGPVECREMPLQDARKAGAIMLFGEKYPDVVRVVSTGGFSKELCGGTHLDNAAQVGLVKILSEESVAAGTRRITALTGPAALAQIRANEKALLQAATALKTRPEELPARVEAMAKEIKTLKKQVAAGAKQEGPSVDALIEGATEKDGVKVIAQEIPGGNANILRDLIDRIRRKTSPVAVMLAAKEEKKVLLIAGFSRDLVEQGRDAVKWVKDTAKVVQGGGGGRPEIWPKPAERSRRRRREALEKAVELI